MIRFKERFSKLKKPNLPNSKMLGKKYNQKKIIKLFYNESTFGPTPQLKKNFRIGSPNIYPEYKEPVLCKQLSKIFKLDIDHFYISNGSDAILDCIPTLFASEKNNVIIPELTFGRIETTCIVEGVELKKIKLKNGRIDLDKTLNAINKNTAIIYIVNPNMPTGKLNSHAKIIEFISKVPSNILIVIDEAYSEYAFGIKKAYEQNKEIIEKYDNVIITHTWSKLYGLAAFRIGYMITRPYIANLFREAYQYLPVNKYSLQAAKIVLSDIPYYDDIVNKIREEKEKYYKVLDKLKLKYFKTTGNFIYIEVKKNKLFNEFLMKKYGVAVRPVRDNALRITIGRPKENLLVFKGLEEFYV